MERIARWTRWLWDPGMGPIFVGDSKIENQVCNPPWFWKWYLDVFSVFYFFWRVRLLYVSRFMFGKSWSSWSFGGRMPNVLSCETSPRIINLESIIIHRTQIALQFWGYQGVAKLAIWNTDFKHSKCALALGSWLQRKLAQGAEDNRTNPCSRLRYTLSIFNNTQWYNWI